MTYQIRKISVQFVLEGGRTFDEAGSTVLTIESARCYASIAGYPIFTDKGLLVITTFSNEIVVGRQITVETSLPNASGDYIISGAMHYITSWIEGGQWNSSMELIPTGTKAVRY